MDAENPVPYFFLGYAHTPERPWVLKFFRDICAEIYERTDLRSVTDVGFMDEVGIPLGSEWREEVVRALANCRVFVPLYSRRYFSREECGYEWHAVAQRILDQRARFPGSPAPIVPALWTPVEPTEIPEVARRIQIHHADLGSEYAREGFYTLIKNALYRDQYTTAIQRLAMHIIRAAERANLRPCDPRDLGPRRNAFTDPGRTSPADRRLTIVPAVSTVDRLPPSRLKAFYSTSSREWNPFHPDTLQPIADYAAGVAAFHSFEPEVMAFDEGFEFLRAREPTMGLGLLLVDPWAGFDDEVAARLRELDDLEMGWVAVMTPWNPGDEQTRQHAGDLLSSLRSVMPKRLGGTRPSLVSHSTKMITLEQFRVRLPVVLESALSSYLTQVEAHPPEGLPSHLPVLGGRERRDPVAGDEETGGRHGQRPRR
ncbi:MAG TPA: TIR-like protein FxsC [Kineosporiaceae bacterium]